MKDALTPRKVRYHGQGTGWHSSYQIELEETCENIFYLYNWAQSAEARDILLTGINVLICYWNYIHSLFRNYDFLLVLEYISAEDIKHMFSDGCKNILIFKLYKQDSDYLHFHRHDFVLELIGSNGIN